MHLPSLLALADPSGGSAVNDMLRLIGVATIVWAFFKGLKSLLAKPPAPLPSQPLPLQAQPAAPAVALATTPAPAQPEGLAPEIVAIIAAAVSSVLGSSHRIVSIKSQNSHWEKAGRQSVLTSHRIR